MSDLAPPVSNGEPPPYRLCISALDGTGVKLPMATRVGTSGLDVPHVTVIVVSEAEGNLSLAGTPPSVICPRPSFEDSRRSTV
jgi:hypothetical protein